MSALSSRGHEASDSAGGGDPSPPLLAVCAAVLSLSVAPASLRRVAGRAIITAIAEDFVLPTETVLASWLWLLNEADTSQGAEVFALVDDEQVRASALRALEGPAVDRHALDVVERVLAGGAHARHLDDDTVRRLIEQSATGRRASAVASVLSGVHRARGLPAALLREVRERWVNGNAHARQAALVIALAEDETEPAFIERLLADPASQATRQPRATSERPPSQARSLAARPSDETRDVASLARDLLEHATLLVDAPGAPRALREVAGAALLEALRQAVELSPAACLAAWHWVVEHPNTRVGPRALEALEATEGDTLRAEALAMLSDPGATDRRSSSVPGGKRVAFSEMRIIPRLAGRCSVRRAGSG